MALAVNRIIQWNHSNSDGDRLVVRDEYRFIVTDNRGHNMYEET